MLYKGSIVFLSDNSGALSIKILNFLNQSKNKPSGKIGDLFVGVVQDFDLNKLKPILKRKDKVISIIVSIKKKYSKKNGIYINFSQNRVIPLKITRFIVPLAPLIFTSSFYELQYFKKFKVIFTSTYAFY